jgi:hypothetical protein
MLGGTSNLYIRRNDFDVSWAATDSRAPLCCAQGLRRGKEAISTWPLAKNPKLFRTMNYFEIE